MLYKGTENEFKWRPFVENCFGKSPMLLVALTENNKIFGAYCDIAFDLSYDKKPGNGNSFIYRLEDDCEVFKVKNGERENYCTE